MKAVTTQTERRPADDRVLVIADRGRLTTQLRSRYPEWDVSTTESFLSGICALSQHGARAVIAFVDASDHQLPDAVAGLREAAGSTTRLILCCRPEAEPVTRKAVSQGADEYILYPIRPEELDRALGYTRPVEWTVPGTPAAPAASMDELGVLARILANLDAEPTAVLQHIAQLVQLASGADGVTIAVQGSAATSGAMITEPVLVEPINAGGRVLGQISLGPRSSTPYRTVDTDKLKHYATVVANLVQAAQRHRHWHKLAITDELSGLPNRRYLLHFLDDVLARAAAEQFRVTLLIFDIDDFKLYNDTCGHEAGDDIIRLVGKLFGHHCREHDVVTRYGGDEFAVVFWDAEQPRVADSRHPADPLEVLERFTRELGSAEPSALKNLPDMQLTISGGLATFPWHANNRDDLIRRADEALIQAKQAGKNRIVTIGQAKEDGA